MRTGAKVKVPPPRIGAARLWNKGLQTSVRVSG